MQLISVNVGLPREVEWRGETILTGIFKSPRQDRVHVGRLDLEGDQQADLTVHGGVDKAVYVYPAEHYAFWRAELPGAELGWGAFGENLTTEGLLETEVRIGDRLRAGTAEFVVTQPRVPCFKLGIRFGRADILKRFQQSGRSGFYLAVLQEGTVAAGDDVEFNSRDDHGVSVADVFRLYAAGALDQELLRRVVEHPVLPESWRAYFRRRLTVGGE